MPDKTGAEMGIEPANNYDPGNPKSTRFPRVEPRSSHVGQLYYTFTRKSIISVILIILL